MFKKGFLRSGAGKLFVCLLAVFLSTAVLAGCGSEVEKVEEPVSEGEGLKEREPLTLRLEGGDWGYSSPFTHYSRGPGIFKMRLVFDSLMERDEEGYIPWLAESWEIGEDGTTYVFNLQEGVKWHDGQEMTAEDVVFSFRYFQEHPPVFIKDILLDPDFLVEVEALSDYQVKMTTSEPDATFLHEAGSVRIIPKHIWEGVDNPQDYLDPEGVIGCGPYKLTDYDKEHGTYRFEAFQDYWGLQHRVDVIEFVPVSDEILAFENGEIDIVRVSTDLLSRFEGDPEFDVLESPAFWGYRVLFNMEREPLFRNNKVRQAFSYAIDPEDLIEKVARGAAIPGNPGILSRHHIWYNPDVSEYDCDPDRAAEIFNEELGGDTSYTLLVGDDAEVRIGEILKEQMARAGIDLTVESTDMKSRDARIAEGQYQLVLVGQGGWGNDPDYLRTRFSSDLSEWASGTPGYENPEIDRLLDQQLTETEEGKRIELIFQLQELLAEDVPEIPIYNTTNYSVFRPERYDGWMFMFDHHEVTHSKLSYLERE